MLPRKRTEIVLIGPPKAGKSTLARWLGAELDVPVVSLDAHMIRLLERANYDLRVDRDLGSAPDVRPLHRYRRPFEAKALATLLSEHQNCVFDLTSTALVAEDAASAKILQQALGAFANVVLVTPSDDPRAALEILRSRTSAMPSDVLMHPAFRDLATRTVVTEGLSARQAGHGLLLTLGLAHTAREPGDDLDRTFIDQYVELQKTRLPAASDYLTTLQDCQAERLAKLMQRLAPKLDVALPERQRVYANDCFAEVHEAAREVLRAAAVPEEARARAERIYAFRLGRGATLRDVLRVDPFDGLAPFLDSAVLEDLLLEPERVRPSVKVLQRAALHHRFLHRPQRTPYMFFHESVVGYLLNVFENRGVVHARGALTVASPTYSEVPAYFIDALATHLGRAAPEVLALHFADRATFEAQVPSALRDLFLIGDYLYQYMELKMLYLSRSVGRRINANLHLFFTVHSLERLAANPELRLRPDAGKIVDDTFCRDIYGYEGTAPRGSNEADIVKILCELAETLWVKS